MTEKFDLAYVRAVIFNLKHIHTYMRTNANTSAAVS